MLILVFRKIKVLILRIAMSSITKYITNIILIFLSLQILNTGLFAQDYNAYSTELNIINSATEYVAEVVLDKGDVFSEHNSNHNQPKHHKHSHNFHLKVQQFILFKHTLQANHFGLATETIANKFLIDNSIRLKNIVFDITPPPPKA